MLRKDKLLGGVLGLAVGDALGVPVEFVQREVLKSSPVESMEGYGSHNQPVGTWSDDTSMVLATLDSMCRGFSTDGMMEAFSRWYNMAEYTPFGEVFDIGGTTRLAIQRYLMGENVSDCGSSDVCSNGNGSLMRMLPMILYLDVTPINSNAVDLIYKVSGLTHAHLISKIACVYYVYIGMYLMVYRDKNEAIEDAIKAVDEYYKDTVYPDTRLESLSRVFTLSEEDIKSSGYVVDSLEASIWCLYNSNSYTEAVLRAVNLERIQIL